MIGNRLKLLRNEKGILQKDLAEKLSLTQQTISLYESNSREPDYETLIKFAKFFNVTVDFLLGLPDKKTRMIPILGKIRAGIPLLAESNWESQVEISTDINADFALRIEGDSMSWIGIHEGDLALLCQTNIANTGDIVAAGVNDGDWCATLKFFLKENNTFLLRAANPSYKDIEFTPEHRIIGKLVSVLKQPPSILTYKNFLVEKDFLNTGWQDVIEIALRYGLDSKQVIQLIELFSHMVKQFK
ncbi:S24 family peptidase [Clostridium sp.]|uniref:LexA family protein n=1 Tax=Clostridium sp. TaxID=1506 RepID=UPI002FCC47EA